MASAMAGSSRPSFALARAAPCLTMARARIMAGKWLVGVPVMGKLWTARRVCTPKRASSGTSRGPMRSDSRRVRPLA